MRIIDESRTLNEIYDTYKSSVFLDLAYAGSKRGASAKITMTKSNQNTVWPIPTHPEVLFVCLFNFRVMGWERVSLYSCSLVASSFSPCTVLLLQTLCLGGYFLNSTLPGTTNRETWDGRSFCRNGGMWLCKPSELNKQWHLVSVFLKIIFQSPACVCGTASDCVI